VRREGEDELAALRVLEVDGDAALVEVVAQERRAGALAVRVDHRGERAAAGLAGAGRLHLHDVGAEPGQQLGAVRQCLHLLDGQDAHAVERLAVPQRLGVGDVSELHLVSFSSIRWTA
jgi:hypothetical protein